MSAHRQNNTGPKIVHKFMYEYGKEKGPLIMRKRDGKFRVVMNSDALEMLGKWRVQSPTCTGQIKSNGQRLVNVCMLSYKLGGPWGLQGGCTVLQGLADRNGDVLWTFPKSVGQSKVENFARREVLSNIQVGPFDISILQETTCIIWLLL
jgi:hypothetical protein